MMNEDDAVFQDKSDTLWYHWGSALPSEVLYAPKPHGPYGSETEARAARQRWQKHSRLGGRECYQLKKSDLQSLPLHKFFWERMLEHMVMTPLIFLGLSAFAYLLGRLLVIAIKLIKGD
jgi:hypothetical protein